ncbi:hypothetical protein CUMW_081130 [Citrus unshiu]|nr:hypothetical protein CUMW_081130 [Citrus unshiu]
MEEPITAYILKLANTRQEKWRLNHLICNTSQTLHQSDDFHCIIQIILGFAGFSTNSTCKNFCPRSNGWTCLGTDDYFKHILIGSIITYTQRNRGRKGLRIRTT